LSKTKVLFDQLQNLTTEQRNPASTDIDNKSIEEILRIINDEDKGIADAIKIQIPFIAEAANIVMKSLRDNGRLIYIGAGTSGRLGVLDAVECPPTFGTDEKMVQGIIAGGRKAMFRAQEGAEDKGKKGALDIDRKKVGSRDVVCGIAASLQTPYVVEAVKRAKQRGAHTIFVTTNPRNKLGQSEFMELAKSIDVAICPDVGPEIIMGSTRMKSGTAQKLVLNMITTTVMIQLGKVYENMMIDLKMTSQKLRERAKRVVMIITGVSYEKASEYLAKSDFNVKPAIVMIKANVNLKEAKARLKQSNGFVRAAIGNQISSIVG
jgi:N-acetylmuramic acid 6-phosphate etherase